MNSPPASIKASDVHLGLIFSLFITIHNLTGSCSDIREEKKTKHHLIYLFVFFKKHGRVWALGFFLQGLLSLTGSVTPPINSICCASYFLQFLDNNSRNRKKKKKKPHQVHSPLRANKILDGYQSVSQPTHQLAIKRHFHKGSSLCKALCVSGVMAPMTHK